MARAATGAAWAAALLLAGQPAPAQAPLSAIDWLREAPTSAPPPGEDPLLPLTPVLEERPEISVRPLDAARIEAVGLYPAARVGLPRNIWGPTTADEIVALLAMLPLDTLPALRDLTYRLLLAEFDPPAGPGGDPDRYVAARIEALMRLGALDQAGALLDTLDPVNPRLAALRFDLRLLLGDDEAACAGLARFIQASAGGVADTTAGSLPAAAVFCQARGGDWAGADRSLQQARDGAAGLAPDYLDLLERFADFDTDSDRAPPAMPARPSPLAWRLLEALGEPVATQGLPLAFAHADLRGTAGWRAQIEAAERLVRAGALPPNRLLGLYTERRAAASGGIWERVRRVQALDAALLRPEPAALGAALLAVWPQIQEGELEVAFADLYGRQLMAAGLTGPAAELATVVGLLSPDYELAALAMPAEAAPRLRRLAAVARGLPPEGARAYGADAEAAILSVFAEPEPLGETVAARLAEGRVGEELLRALIRIGASGDPRMLAEGLTLMRHLGLEDIARRAALQALLLDRRG